MPAGEEMTLAKWLEWLQKHPDAYVIVAKDVWEHWRGQVENVADAKGEFPFGMQVRMSPLLAPGRVIGMIDRFPVAESFSANQPPLYELPKKAAP